VDLCVYDVSDSESALELNPEVVTLTPGTFYVILRGHWFNVIDLTLHAPSEEKSDDSKDSFYEELEQVFDHFCM